MGRIDEPAKPLDGLFERLSKSSFRRRFRLSEQDRKYIVQKGMDTVLRHARDFIRNRLAPARPDNDGKQTPMRGHPVFVAQHATATCCRSCLEKWHRLPRDRVLTADQQDYVFEVIRCWLFRQAPEK